MNLIIDKYSKYNIHFNQFSKNIIIKSEIPVKVFMTLKTDLKNLNLYVKDIIVDNFL